MSIDFYASMEHYAEHMEPIWDEIPSNWKGNFYLPEKIAQKMGDKYTPLDQTSLQKDTPILTCSHKDLLTVYTSSRNRTLFLMEHGVGLVFPGNPGYAGNGGLRKKVSLTLAPNKNVYDKTKRAIPNAKQVIIGTPKLDKWANELKKDKKMPEKPIVCIGFHWPGFNIAPEAGNALWYYEKELKNLANQSNFKLVGHAHPRHADKMIAVYDKYGIPFIRTFEKVMEIANVYICDASSTIYEWLVTGWPVILLNSPRYRRAINFGIRFWEYTDVGPQVNFPKDLLYYVNWTIENPNYYKEKRLNAIRDLYPNLGISSKCAASAMVKFLGG